MSNVQRRDNSILQDRRLEGRVADIELWRRNGGGGSGGSPGPTGPAGPTGATGATGATGLAGAAGLTWRGVWAAGTAYSVNDAVSYTTTLGATNSYRRLVAGTTATTPDQDAVNWALIASGVIPVTLGVWTALPLVAANWVDLNSDYPCQYRKDSDGFVQLRGLAKALSARSVGDRICTLPVGVRPGVMPNGELIYLGYGNFTGGVRGISVEGSSKALPYGLLIILAQATGEYISLDMINYRAEA